MDRRIIAAAGLAVGITVLAGSPASAHTPAISATCDGVRVVATNYNPAAENTWVVVVDGVETRGTFGQSLNELIPVPQEGKTTTWGAQISDPDGRYAQALNGAVGPCGEAPPVEEPPVEEPPAEEPPVVVPPVEEPPVVVPPVEPPAAVPPVTPAPPVTTVEAPKRLASTGPVTGWMVPLGGGLLLAGIAAVASRLRRRVQG